MIVVSVHMRVKPSKRGDVVKLAQGMIAPSRAEDGCISYNFFSDTLDPNAFLFFEEWKSRETLKAHGETEHFIGYSQSLAGLIEDRSVRVYEVTSVEQV